jgi:hypothetical protein
VCPAHKSHATCCSLNRQNCCSFPPARTDNTSPTNTALLARSRQRNAIQVALHRLPRNAYTSGIGPSTTVKEVDQARPRQLAISASDRKPTGPREKARPDDADCAGPPRRLWSAERGLMQPCPSPEHGVVPALEKRPRRTAVRSIVVCLVSGRDAIIGPVGPSSPTSTDLARGQFALVVVRGTRQAQAAIRYAARRS